MEDRRQPEANGLREASDLGQNRERPPASVHDSLRQYSTLLEINNAIISNLTRESLFHAISEALRKVVPFDRALLYVAENDVLRTVALEGQELSGARSRCAQEISPQGTAAGWAFEHREPRLSHNLATGASTPGGRDPVRRRSTFVPDRSAHRAGTSHRRIVARELRTRSVHARGRPVPGGSCETDCPRRREHAGV